MRAHVSLSPVLATLVLLSLLACSPRLNEKGQKVDKYNRTAKTAKGYAEAVKARRLKPGMTKGEVREIMRGKPEETSRQNRGDTEYLVWEYRSRSLDLFFDYEGFLVTWHAPY